MSTIRDILMLKRVDIVSASPDTSVRDVAALMTESYNKLEALHELKKSQIVKYAALRRFDNRPVKPRLGGVVAGPADAQRHLRTIKLFGRGDRCLPVGSRADHFDRRVCFQEAR